MSQLGTPISEVEVSKPRITRVILSRKMVRWIILMGGGMVGFKNQTQFKSFACACFIAGCIRPHL